MFFAPHRTLDVEPAELLQNVELLSSEDERDEMAVPSYCHRNPLIQRLFWKRLRVALELLAPRPGERCLDFGSGTGVLLPALSGRVGKVYAADLVPIAARQMVTRRGLLNVEVLDPVLPTLADIGNEPLDAIVALDVLEHVDDLAGIVRHFRSLLRPGGRVIMSGPTETSLYRLGRLLAGFAGKGHYHHTNVFDIRNKFLEAGYRLVEERRLPSRPLPRFFLIDRFEL
jgi:SAM-dependent methyltransferase